MCSNVSPCNQLRYISDQSVWIVKEDATRQKERKESDDVMNGRFIVYFDQMKRRNERKKK